ncbi:MAG: response regulator [Acidobacteria bacterium]|nr:response regulator [Acidobacteriota bacterium]
MADTPNTTQKTFNILVVEDSPTQLEALRSLLEESGFSVVAATNGKEGLAAAQANPIDLVISDIVMPEMDGYALCKALRDDQTCRRLPVILLTSLTDPQDVIQGLESGANNFICKPYDDRGLVARVQNVLTNQEIRRTTSSEMGLSVFFAGQPFFITADRLQILDLLLSTYEVAIQQNRELLSAREELRLQNAILEKKVRERTANLMAEVTERERAERTLREAKEHLEIRVKERTVELEQTNRTLQVEIAERKLAEEAVNLERQRLYDVLETLPAYVILLSADYHVPFANRVFRERFGESEGRRCYEYLFNRTASCEICETYTVLKTAAPHHWEWFGPDGRNYDIFDFPFTDTDGTPLILEMGIDITETKRARTALTEANESLERRVADRTTELRLSEARLRDVVFSVADWVWEVDENGVYTYSSEKGYDLLGVSSEDVVGKTPFDFMPPDEARRVGAIFSEIAARKAPIRDLENWNIRRNGERVCLLTNAAPILDEAGNLRGYRGVDKDITTQRQLEAQFLQAQKMEVVGRLASGIAHDFNNLLTIINGTADLMLTDLKESGPQRSDLQDIRQAGEQAASLTRQLLAFSRKQIMKFEALDLSKLVADIQGILQRLIGEDIALVVVPAKDVGCVMADSAQIQQVVMNLTVNARDAMPNGGTLTIETRDIVLDEAYAEEHPSVQSGPHVMLAISDTGTGMDEATRARIFEPFFTTKGPGKGTGLGLSTVYGIVKQSGGSIWVYSEPGMGTTFKIYLPRVERVVHKIQPAPAVVSVQGVETILLVEDDEAVRCLAKRVLQKAGYTVLTASNGAEALLLLERHDGPVHLMLTDMVMPGMSGRELVARIGHLSPRTKILCTSGYTDEAILHQGLLAEAAHFIGKPYSVAELTRKVREVLES